MDHGATFYWGPKIKKTSRVVKNGNAFVGHTPTVNWVCDTSSLRLRL